VFFSLPAAKHSSPDSILQSKGAPMTTDHSQQIGGSRKAKRAHVAVPQAESSPGQTVIDVDRSGDWMPADELRAASLAALEAGSDVTLHLGQVDHLDASALQILLALGVEQKRRGRQLEVASASPHLRQWFEYAGAAAEFFPDGAEAQ
jgi:anti-anti-sigma regulatory factor